MLNYKIRIIDEKMAYDFVGFIVAALIIIGGAIGYFKAGN